MHFSFISINCSRAISKACIEIITNVFYVVEKKNLLSTKIYQLNIRCSENWCTNKTPADPLCVFLTRGNFFNTYIKILGPRYWFHGHLVRDMFCRTMLILYRKGLRIEESFFTRRGLPVGQSSTLKKGFLDP